MTVDVAGVTLTGADINYGAGRIGVIGKTIGQGVVAGEVAEGNGPLEVLVFPVGTPDVEAHPYFIGIVTHTGVVIMTGAALDLLHVVVGTVSAEFCCREGAGRAGAGAARCKGGRAADRGVPGRIAVTGGTAGGIDYAVNMKRL